VGDTPGGSHVLGLCPKPQRCEGMAKKEETEMKGGKRMVRREGTRRRDKKKKLEGRNGRDRVSLPFDNCLDTQLTAIIGVFQVESHIIMVLVAWLQN